MKTIKTFKGDLCVRKFRREARKAIKLCKNNNIDIIQSLEKFTRKHAGGCSLI